MENKTVERTEELLELISKLSKVVVILAELLDEQIDTSFCIAADDEFLTQELFDELGKVQVFAKFIIEALADEDFSEVAL